MEIIYINPLIEYIPTKFHPSNLSMDCQLQGLYNHSGNITYVKANTNDASCMGNIIHDIHEFESKGKINNDIEFDDIWNQSEAKQVEISLRHAILNYGKIQYLTKKQILKEKRYPIEKKNEKSFKKAETILHDEITGIIGRIDLIIFKNNVPYEIKEFKTGRVFVSSTVNVSIDFNEILLKHRNQLYFYAFLIFKKYGIYPSILTISYGHGNEVSTRCDKAVVEKLIDQFSKYKRNLLTLTAEKLATPTIDNCQYCSFKPGCNWSINYAKGKSEDLIEIVKDIKHYKYGNFSLELQNGKVFFYGAPFIGERTILEGLVGKAVFISNVRPKGSNKTLYTSTRHSKIYCKTLWL